MAFLLSACEIIEQWVLDELAELLKGKSLKLSVDKVKYKQLTLCNEKISLMFNGCQKEKMTITRIEFQNKKVTKSTVCVISLFYCVE